MNRMGCVPGLGCVLIAILLFTTPVSAASQSDIKASLKQATTRWQSEAKELRVPGFTLLVVSHAGPLFHYSFGGRDCEARHLPNADTMYYIASATKPFTAAAIMQLSERKQLELDAPVKRYLPRFELGEPKLTESVTIRDLLSHRAGLENFPIDVATAFTGQMDDDKFYRLLKQTTARGKFRYSNLHYLLLGKVIEGVTGKRWNEYVEENVFRPAEMRRSVTTETALQSDQNSACALEETSTGWKTALVQKTDRTMHSAGGIGSTADDLGRWMQVQLQKGALGKKRVLSEASMEQMFTPQTEVGSEYFLFKRQAYGLGWYIGSYRDVPMIHHFGSFEGARAHLSFLPGHDIAVVVLMNEESPVNNFVDAVASDVYDIALNLPPGEQWKRAHESVEKSRASIEAMWKGYVPLVRSAMPTTGVAGKYESADWGLLEVEQKGEAVSAHIGDLPIPMYFDPEKKSMGAEIIELPFAMTVEKGAIVFRRGKSMELRFEWVRMQ